MQKQKRCSTKTSNSMQTQFITWDYCKKTQETHKTTKKKKQISDVKDT